MAQVAYMLRIFALLLAATPAAVAVVHAQTLDLRPAAFAEPRPGNRARHGEVVLGQTTITGVRRMLADLLLSDSVMVPLGHPGNPAPVPPGTVWEVGANRVHPSQRLDLGPDHYMLYFDKNERLIAAITQRAPSGLTRAKLAARFPTLQKGRRWYAGDRPRMDQWTAALSPCVTLAAHVLVLDERVEQVGYIYTCAIPAQQ